MPDIQAIVTMAHEIKATGITPATWQRWKEICEYLGDDTNAKTMTALVTLVHTLFVSSRWEDTQRKAAQLVTAQWADRSKEIIPMHPSEVKRVSQDATKVHIYTKGQGEPYLISRDVWDKS